MHALLVQELEVLIRKNFDERTLLLFADVPGASSDSKPPQLYGFVPDVYVARPRYIIGEAKTMKDLDTRHSQDQIASFLRYLTTQENGLFILAVPLHAWNYGKSVIRHLKSKTEAREVQTLCIYGGYSSSSSGSRLDSELLA